MKFDPEKMYKLPQSCRFFDINKIWYFANRWAVRLLFELPINANQITGLSLVLGVLAGFFYFSGREDGLLLAGAFLYGKLFFDNVDGPLARVRGEESRLGRFLDSITDFAVNVFVYTGITYYLVEKTGDGSWWLWGAAALLSCLLHCSYFVFYLVQYTSRLGIYKQNRVREELTEADRKAALSGKLSGPVYFFQSIHTLVYGWQDRLMEAVDEISRRWAGKFPEQQTDWYTDSVFLSLTSPLCLCTNTMVLVVSSLLNLLEPGLILIVVLGNAYWIGLVVWKIFKSRK